MQIVFIMNHYFLPLFNFQSAGAGGSGVESYRDSQVTEVMSGGREEKSKEVDDPKIKLSLLYFLPKFILLLCHFLYSRGKLGTAQKYLESER